MTSTSTQLPLAQDGESTILSVHVHPKARKNAIEGVKADAEGKLWLTIRTTAAPEDGKANKAVIQLLSKTWRIPASAFSLLSGDTSRYKRIRIARSPQEIEEWLKHPRP